MSSRIIFSETTYPNLCCESRCKSFFCYTTVFNVIELFALARSERERQVIEESMSAMKILGLNAKNAKQYGELVARGMVLPRLNTLVAGICLDSKLPVLTLQPREFRGVKGLVIVHALLVNKEKSGTGIMNESKLHSIGYHKR